jgi:hemerythrin-like domain-containing protein
VIPIVLLGMSLAQSTWESGVVIGLDRVSPHARLSTQTPHRTPNHDPESMRSAVMKATALLKRQHREVERLFSRALKSDNARARQNARDAIIQALQEHTEIEESVFYPAVREVGTKKAEEMVGEAYEEHHVVKLVLAELPKLDPNADNFDAKMTVLKELIKHHVEEEEDEMFPMAERRLGDERMSELGEQMDSER